MITLLLTSTEGIKKGNTLQLDKNYYKVVKVVDGTAIKARRTIIKPKDYVSIEWE